MKYDNYPYDGILFHSNDINKLPRSKLDRYLNTSYTRYVPRFDHYCGWIHNNVGEENYRFFLMFLFIQFGMCIYGSVIVYRLMRGIVVELNLFEATFVRVMPPLTSTSANAQDDQVIYEDDVMIQADLFVVAQYLTMKHFQVVALGVLMIGMAIVLGLFVLFHLYITARGMTTNEFFKWRGIRQCMLSVQRDAYALRPELLAEGLPKNIYDHGFVENFKEVFWPRCLRKAALDRLALAQSPQRDGDHAIEKRTSTNGIIKSKVQ